MAKKIDETNILLEHIVDAIIDIKGNKIMSLDLRKVESAICKYFVICTGTSDTHTNAIKGNIKKFISKKIGENPSHVEGTSKSEWILIDYFDIIVHIFQENTRNFYNIEDLWADAIVKKYQD